MYIFQGRTIKEEGMDNGALINCLQKFFGIMSIEDFIMRVDSFIVNCPLILLIRKCRGGDRFKSRLITASYHN